MRKRERRVGRESYWDRESREKRERKGDGKREREKRRREGGYFIYYCPFLHNLFLPSFPVALREWPRFMAGCSAALVLFRLVHSILECNVVFGILWWVVLCFRQPIKVGICMKTTERRGISIIPIIVIIIITIIFISLLLFSLLLSLSLLYL